MFSMAYQIRWLNCILKFKKLKLPNPYKDENFINCITNDNNITDDNMVISRNYLYRPNLNAYLNNKIKK